MRDRSTRSGGRDAPGGRGPATRDAVAIRAPAGIVSYDPADLTVCAGAGTTVDELEAVLGAAGQESALDPRDPERDRRRDARRRALRDPRRLRVGPVRDQVLEVHFATADGRLVHGGGPTVKNVTGYDLPRLLVGSFGTLGVLTRVILRCRPRPPCRDWYRTDDDPLAVRERDVQALDDPVGRHHDVRAARGLRG